MTAPRYDITIEQSATFEMFLVYKNAAGVVVDLSLYDAEMQVRESVGGRVLATATKTNGRIVMNASGQVNISIPALETRLIDSPRGVYDLFITPPGGTPVRKVIFGDVDIKTSVTR